MEVKFLDRSNLTKAIYIVNRGLTFCSWVQSYAGKSPLMSILMLFVFFSCHICRTTVCWVPEILLPWKRDVTTSPLCPFLVSTARSPIILWRLWSHKPSHKHDSNKYQSKAFVICDHKSDETRSVTHVNKVYLVWLMFRVVSSQHYQHRTNQKLRLWANAIFQNPGVCGQAFLRHSLFLLSSQLSRLTRAETLATQARP